MSKIKTVLRLLSRKSVTAPIGDRDFTFYPLSVGVMNELAERGAGITTAFRALQGGSKAFTPKQTSQFEKDPVSGAMIETVIREEPSEALLKLQREQSDEITRSAINTLLGKENITFLGRIIVDSLRDDFERETPDQEVFEFISQLDLAQVHDAIKGVFAANKAVFGPLAVRAMAWLKTKMPTSPLAQDTSELDGSEPEVRLG